jgi:prepilin-type N-terminal cleavage/methylation domain-containing protein
MKKFKKKLSGMTLIEMIISLAVFASLALILATMGSAVEKHTREARKINNNVAVNGPIAEAQRTNDSYISDDKFVIQVAKAGDVQKDGGGNPVTNANGEEMLNYINIEGTLCYVNPTTTDSNKNSAVVTNATDTNGELVLDPTFDPGDYVPKYVIVTMPTNTTVSTTTTTSITP